MYKTYSEPLNRIYLQKLGGVPFNNWVTLNERKYRELFYEDNQSKLTLPTFEDWVFEKYSNNTRPPTLNKDNFGQTMRKRMGIL